MPAENVSVEIPREMIVAILNQFLTSPTSDDTYEDRLRRVLAVHLPEHEKRLQAERDDAIARAEAAEAEVAALSKDAR